MLTNSQLSASAEKVINHYLNLPFSDKHGIRCPYFNNAKLGQRGQLKALIGKGTPTEIVEEAKILSVQYKQNIANPEITADDIRKFLIEHNLGVDCSGFITNVMQAELADRGVNLVTQIFITPKIHIFRWLISKLRPVEQISVQVLANEKNTKAINNLADIKAGDMIMILKTGPKKTRDHILLVTRIDTDKISYAHARAWSSEGRYGHGVSVGTITIINPAKVLLDQLWEEKGMKNENNETFLEAKQAAIVVIKRFTAH
jgi:hypothetical protein